MVYLNEGHLGGIWIPEEYEDHEICETCFDVDDFTEFETLKELLMYAIREYGKDYVEKELGYEVEITYREVRHDKRQNG